MAASVSAGAALASAVAIRGPSHGPRVSTGASTTDAATAVTFTAQARATTACPSRSQAPTCRRADATCTTAVAGSAPRAAAITGSTTAATPAFPDGRRAAHP